MKTSSNSRIRSTLMLGFGLIACSGALLPDGAFAKASRRVVTDELTSTEFSLAGKERVHFSFANHTGALTRVSLNVKDDEGTVVLKKSLLLRDSQAFQNVVLRAQDLDEGEGTLHVELKYRFSCAVDSQEQSLIVVRLAKHAGPVRQDITPSIVGNPCVGSIHGWSSPATAFGGWQHAARTPPTGRDDT